MEQYKLQQVHQNSCRFFNKIAYDQDYNGLALSGALEGERLGKMLQGNEGNTRGSLRWLKKSSEEAISRDSMHA